MASTEEETLPLATLQNMGAPATADKAFCGAKTSLLGVLLRKVNVHVCFEGTASTPVAQVGVRWFDLPEALQSELCSTRPDEIK